VLIHFFRWVIHSLSLNNDNITSDKLPNSDLLKPNSTIITCLSNIKTTAENHFQVSFYTLL